MIGTRLHNYKIEKLIDEGGMGTIYMGIHMFLGRKVAIKALNPILFQKPDIRERFKNEAITMSKLHHPNIVALYDYIENRDGIYIVMEYIEGITLDQYLEKFSGPIPESRVAKLFIQILDAVAYIHSKNIIHRDLKPSNFIITPNDEIKILDFGISKILENADNLKLTKSGSKVGTALYMSPQQVKGQVLDRRTDIYSMGVTLFQMVTGQYPYDKNLSEYDIYTKILEEPFPNAKDYYVGVSDKMQEIIIKATAKKPIDRFQNCEEFSSAMLLTQNNFEQPSLSLKTKILEVADIRIGSTLFNKTFWRGLLLIFITVSFVSAIGTVVYFVLQSDVRHVIADKLQLSAVDSIGAEKIESLTYGETVKIVEENVHYDKQGNAWLKVVSLRGNNGYITKNHLAKPKIFEQINIIFGNNFAQAQTPTDYKWILRKFFVENHLYAKYDTQWKIYSEPKKDFEFNFIAEADFNDNGTNDFACILKNKKLNVVKLLVLFDNSTEQAAIIDFEENIKIKPLLKGKDGGGWYLGNQFTKTGNNGEKLITNKYEFLASDGLLVLKTDSKKTFVYLYNATEKKLAVFEQP